MSGNFEVDSINNSMLTVDAEESSIKKRNKESISSLCEGDIISFYKGGDGLYALYIGDERIVRLVSETRSDEEGMFIIGGLKYRTATVTEESFWKLGDEMIVVKESKNDEPHTPLQGKTITTNALKYIGDVKHPELFKTCKEFAIFCRYGNVQNATSAQGTEMRDTTATSTAPTAAHVSVSLLDIFNTVTNVCTLIAVISVMFPKMKTQ